MSSSLPRKFKIAFEGCSDDHIGSAINDIGWHARIQDRRRTRARLQGHRRRRHGDDDEGRATSCTSSCPSSEMFDCAEAILRVFHRLGDYKHKQRNRLKFLVKSLGWDGFRAEYERERAASSRRRDARCRSIPSTRRSRTRRPGAERRALSLDRDCRARRRPRP